MKEREIDSAVQSERTPMWRESLEKVERACEVGTGLCHEAAAKKKKKKKKRRKNKKKKKGRRRDEEEEEKRKKKRKKKKNWSQRKCIFKNCRITHSNK
jgi:hypothetical protein